MVEVDFELRSELSTREWGGWEALLGTLKSNIEETSELGRDNLKIGHPRGLRMIEGKVKREAWSPGAWSQGKTECDHKGTWPCELDAVLRTWRSLWLVDSARTGAEAWGLENERRGLEAWEILLRSKRGNDGRKKGTKASHSVCCAQMVLAWGHLFWPAVGRGKITHFWREVEEAGTKDPSVTQSGQGERKSSQVRLPGRADLLQRVTEVCDLCHTFFYFTQ